MTALRDLLDTAVPFALPLVTTFRGLDVREGVLLHGPSGWGEFAPFDDYSDAAAARWLDAAIEAAFDERPRAVRDAVEVNAIVPSCHSSLASSLTREAVARGCTTVKVKVGSALLDDDIARVGAVREVLGSAGAIRVDANAGWSIDQAVVALGQLAPFDLEYAEQPVATRDLGALRRRVSVPIAVDEGIRQSADPAGALRWLREIADVAILKPQPLGGAAATLRLAQALDMPVVVSGSLDSSVGLSAVVAAAAALPRLPFASGVGTGALLGADVVRAPVVAVDGRITVGRIAPDESALASARARVTPRRREYWLARLTAAWNARERVSP